jgi:DNA-binding transcriptional ArsR family regulator
MANASTAFAALADPTRRKIFEKLAGKPLPVAAIARGLPVSRPAVSQHLKILREAGLVTDRSQGAQRIYQIDTKGLGAIRAWLDRFWDDALAAFKDELESTDAETNHPKPSDMEKRDE